MTRSGYLLFGLLVLAACKNKDTIPEGILKPEKMQVVLWDVIKADAFTADFIKRDTAKNTAAENLKLQQQIFAIHKINKAYFYTSYDYYKSNTPLFKKILDSIISNAERSKYIKAMPAAAE
jgi:ribosomal protein L22